MALSSICFQGIFSLMGITGSVGVASQLPHWFRVQEPGHFDDGIDEECAVFLAPEQREELLKWSPEMREVGRRALVAEGRRPGLLRRMTGQLGALWSEPLPPGRGGK